MFKLGIYSPKQLKAGARHTVFGAYKKISVTLLADVREIDVYSDAYAAIMFDLNDDRGTFKRTYRDRFVEFDGRCIEIMRQHFRGSSLQIHDVAVSSGETAVDFFQQIKPLFPRLTYDATDYGATLTVLRKGPLAVTLSSNGEIVEIMLPPFVFSQKPPDRWFYPVNRLLHGFLKGTVARRMVEHYQARQLNAKNVSTISLFSPRAQKLAASNESFRLGEYDVLTPMSREYDCIRAMNVLNDSYFSANDMQVILTNFCHALRNMGLLIVGSNLDAGTPVQGGIYFKTASGFEPLWETDSAFRSHVIIFNETTSAVPIDTLSL